MENTKNNANIYAAFHNTVVAAVMFEELYCRSVAMTTRETKKTSSVRTIVSIGNVRDILNASNR